MLIKIVRAILIFVLIFAPIPFGSVHVWAYSLVNVLVLGAGVLWLVGNASGAVRNARVGWIATAADVPALLFVLWTGFQLLPLPLWFVDVLSPQAADIWRGVFQITGLPETWKTLSLVPHDTRIALVQAVTYVCLFQLTLQVVDSRESRIQLTRVLIVLGACLALYGLFEKASGHNAILWWKNSFSGSFRIFGTFINPDHFGFYLNLIIPLALGYVYRRRFQPEHKSVKKRKLSLFKRIVHLAIDTEAKAQKTGLLVFFTAIMMSVSVLTGSRAAMLALGGSLSVMAALVWVRTRKRGFAILLISALVLAGCYGMQIGLEPVLQRWKTFDQFNLERDARWMFWASGMDIVGDYPLTGTGLGTLEAVFPAYRPAEKGLKTTDHLHNDWLEILAETGIPGFLFFVGGYCFLLYSMIRRWWHQRSTLAMGLGLGAIGAMVAAGLHSLLDFGLHMPGNGMTLAAILGLGFAGLKTGGRRPEAGDRRQETGSRRQETGSGRREAGDGKREAGDGRQKTVPYSRKSAIKTRKFYNP